MPNEDERQELDAAVGARRELGPVYEDAVLESFLAKIDRSIESRVDARLDARRHEGAPPPVRSGDHQLVLGIVSLGTGIPITAIAGGIGHLGGIVAAWLGIAAVNAAYSATTRRRF